jgi:type VI secretion system protein ImpA
MFNATDLLKPINSLQVCGEEISFSREIDVIMEARRHEDASLNQGEWIADIKNADWPLVVETCVSLISSQSKDIRFAVWLTEASAKVDHFSGLAEGYLLIAGLFDVFWENFYPLAVDSDGQEQRIGNLSWVLSRSIQLIKEMPITEGKNTAFSTIDFEIARKRAANVETTSDNKQIDDNRNLAVMELAKRKSSKSFYEKLLNDIKHCKFALQALEKSVDARLGIDGPSFSATKETLDEMLRTITRFGQEIGVSPSNAELNQTAISRDNINLLELAPQKEFNGQIQNRADALIQLRSVAEFFRRTEPHSPVAYLADKAASWGDMPLHAWLSTVIKDPSALSQVEELLGIGMARNVTPNIDE